MLGLALALLVGGVALYVYVPSLLLYWRYPWPVYGLLAAAVLVASRSRGRRWARWSVTGLAALLLGLFVTYSVSLSYLGEHRLAVAPGDRFPDFELRTSTNETFSPADLRGKSAALFVFYRGDW